MTGPRKGNTRSRAFSQDSVFVARKNRKKSPEESAGYFSQLFFLWMLPFLYRKTSQELGRDDNYDITTDLSCQLLGDRLESEWTNEILQAMDGGRMPLLTLAIWKTFAPSLFILIFSRVCIDGCLTGQAVLLEHFVQTPAYPNGLYYGLAICGCSLVYVMLHQAWTSLAITLGLQMRVACLSLLYRKALRISLLSIHEQQVPHLLMHLMHSVANFDLLPVHLPHMVAGPLSAIIVSCVLWKHLGPICLVGFTFLALLVPLQVFVGKMISDLLTSVTTTTVDKLRLLREIAAGIVQIKQMAWEVYFGGKCETARKKETHTLVRATLLHAIISIAHAQGTRLMTLITITTFVLIGYSFSISKAFLTLCVIQVLRAPLCVHLPLGITLMSKLATITQELQDLLLINESMDKEQRLNRSGPIYSRIILMEVSAKWDHTVRCWNKDNSASRASCGSIALATLQPLTSQLCNTALVPVIATPTTTESGWAGCHAAHTLSRLQVGVKQGELLVVMGAPGAGKSSFLCLLLGELNACSGKVQINGRMSYCAQRPWVFPGTIRRNIICGSPFKEDRFKKVLDVCDLTNEVEAIEDWRHCRIGRAEVTLTKNQQARITLARAIYQEADIYLLDNPMAELSRSLSMKIFEKLKRFLNNNCVVLVTNKVSFMEQAHQILVLEEGRVIGSGPLDDLTGGEIDLGKIASFDSHEDMEDDDSVSAVAGRFSRGASESEQECRKTMENPVVGNVPYSDLVGDGRDFNRYLSFENRDNSFESEEEGKDVQECVTLPTSEDIEEEVEEGDLEEEEGELGGEESEDESQRGFTVVETKGVEDAVFGPTVTLARTRKTGIEVNTRPRSADTGRTSSSSTTLSVPPQDLDEEEDRNLRAREFSPKNSQPEIILDPVDLYTYCRKPSSNPMLSACSPQCSRSNIFDSTKKVYNDKDDKDDGNATDDVRTWTSVHVLLLYIRSGGTRRHWVLAGVTLLVYQLALCSWEFTFLMWAMDNDNDTYTTGEWFQELEPGNNYYLNALWIIIAATILVGLSAFLGVLWIFTRAAQRLHTGLLTSLVQAPLKLLDKKCLASFLKLFSQDMKIIDDILPPIVLETVQYFMMIIACVIIISVTNWILIFPLLIVMLTTFLSVYLSLARTRAMQRKQELKLNDVMQHLDMTLEGICTIRALDAESLFLSQFSVVTNKHTSSLLLTKSVSLALGLWLGLVTVLVTLSVTLVFGLIHQGSESKPAYVGLAIYCSLVITTLVPETVTYCALVSNFMNSVGRIFEQSEIRREESGAVVLSSVRTVSEVMIDSDWPHGGQIQANHLSLKFNEDEAYVLLCLNFKIKAGEKVGVVGGLGAGKSALLVALLRLMEPTPESSVLIDEIDTRNVSLKTLRERISVVPRFPLVFSGCLRDNLDPRREMPDNVLWDALEKVELRATVQGLPSGLQTDSLTWNETLTTHQRQLLCLARAVLDNNKILIVDMATGNLNPETVLDNNKILIVDMATGNLNPNHEASMLHAINKYFGNCTVLILSHRLRSVMKTDRVLVLEQGRMGEFGHPFLLLQNRYSHFYKMVERKSPLLRAQLMALAREAYLGERLKEEAHQVINR